MQLAAVLGENDVKLVPEIALGSDSSGQALLGAMLAKVLPATALGLTATPPEVSLAPAPKRREA